MARKPREDAPTGAEPAHPPVTIDLPASEIGEAPPAEARPAEAASLPPTRTVETAGPAEPEPPEAAEPMRQPAPPPPVRSPKAVPAFLGLVAGALGGFGAWHLGDYLNPPRPPALVQAGPSQAAFAALETRLKGIEEAAKPASAPAPALPPELAQRLDKAEAALAEAVKRETGLKDEIGRLANALASESAARDKAIAELAARPPQTAPVGIMSQSAPPADAAAKAEIDGLKNRLAQMEAGTRALPAAIGQAAAKGEAAANRVDGIAPRVEAVASRIDGIAPKVDAVSTRVEQLAPKLEQVGNDVAGLGKTIAGLAGRDQLARAASVQAATAILDDAFARGEALAAPLGVLANLGVPQAALTPFQPFAERGAPNASALLAELRAVPPKPPEAKPNADLFERLKSGALSLVEVRQTGEITGSDDAAHLGRAEQALGRGDIATALTLVGRLSAQRGEAYAPWRARAEARLKAADALVAIKRNSLAELAKAAGGAK